MTTEKTNTDSNKILHPGMRILVVGLGKSGVAAIKFFLQHGAVVTVSDASPQNTLDLKTMDWLSESNIVHETGKHTEDMFTSADMIFVSPGIPLTIEPLAAARRRSIPILGELAVAAHYLKTPAVGITGTNGKTSAAWFLQHILTSAGIRAGLTGTVENRFEENRYPQHLTTPEVHEFNHLLHLMRSQGAEYVVSEVSSQGIDKGRIDGLVFSQALFTNLSGEHLDYHLTMEDYFTAKRKLFDSVSEQGFSVVNRDDTYGQRLCEELETARTVSLEGDAYVSGRIRRQSSDGTDLEIACGDERGEVTVSRPGRFNCMNYLIAAASALCAGVSFSQVLNAGSTLPVVPGRIEEVETGCNFRVYVDYAHTDNALENVLSSLREFTAGRIITVFGAGGDRDRRKRPRMGKAAVEYSDCAIITSDNPRTEDPDSIISDILAGTDGREYASVRDRKEAIFRALETAGEGDAVIIAGKGHEDYQIVGTEKTHFSDAETVRDYFMNKAEQV